MQFRNLQNFLYHRILYVVGFDSDLGALDGAEDLLRQRVEFPAFVSDALNPHLIRVGRTGAVWV